MDLHSPHLVNQNIERIAQLFPNCVTESAEGLKIDFDQLRQELSGDIIEGGKERYRLDWPGKREAIVTGNLPTTSTLRPARDESVDFDNTENIYIEGDNLEVLKVLQESYLNKVKMIYIDPPYNTGKDFVYRDNFATDVKEWREREYCDEAGRRMEVNPNGAGRYHSDWLSMMYPRLKLARNLLTEDGVIFISIDDNEVHNLRKICDEIYGEENFVAQISVQSNPRGRQSDTFMASVHDYLLMYAKNLRECSINGAPLSDEQKSEFSFVDENGNYRLLGLRQRGSASRREDRPDMYFPIYVNPNDGKVYLEKKIGYMEVFPRKSDGTDGRWMWGKAKCETDISLLVSKMIEHRGEYDIFIKDYLNRGESERTRKYKTIWDDKKYNNQFGTQEVKALIGDVFTFPKSSKLLSDIIRMGSIFDDKSIIFDFFSGSATTAHAVMQLNAEDGGNRKYIMVQLPEETDEESEAYKAGYKNIAEIGKERIRRAATQIKTQQEAKKEAKVGEIFGQEKDTAKVNLLDLGFRVYKLDSSNMKDVYYRPASLEQDQLDMFTDNIKADRTEEDLVTQIMLDWGLPLSLKIEQKEILGTKVYAVADDYLYCCFDRGVNEEFARKVAKDKPLRIVFRDSGFANDTAKENVRQLLRQLTPETQMRVI